MSVGFSTVIYKVALGQLDRQLPADSGLFGEIDPDSTAQVSRYLSDRVRAGKQEILLELVAMNVVVLVTGAFVSNLLARLFLRPIEDVMVAQTRFVSDASHELRTPLTAIQTTNEVALRDASLSLKDAREVIQSNLDDVERLQRMSTMLLQLANRDAHLDLTPVEIHDVVSRALTDSAAKAMARDITVDDQTGRFSIMADPDAAAQALTVVLDNAIKYSPDASTITLTTAAERHGMMQIRVTDQGTGIAPDDIHKLFDRFFRSDQARTRQGHDGYGLGLAIAKQIMGLHGGSITVTSRLGKGSTFALRFVSLGQHKPKKR